jgi:hypothetical protein
MTKPAAIDRERRRRRSKRKKLQLESASGQLIGTEEATRRLLRPLCLIFHPT